jgi:hypothetical protein
LKKIRRRNVKKTLRTVAPADPSLWNEKDQGSLSASYKTQYQDIAFRCYHCRETCVFTADDQKYTYEVKKAPIDQARNLCEPCWRVSHTIAAGIALCQQQWAEAKPSLVKDEQFLARWLALLVSSRAYGIRQNGAAEAMLGKLLAKLEANGPASHPRLP